MYQEFKDGILEQNNFSMNTCFVSGLVTRWNNHSKYQLLDWPISHRILSRSLLLTMWREKKTLFLLVSCCLCKIPKESKVACIMVHNPFIIPPSVIIDDTRIPRTPVRKQQEHTRTVLTGSFKGLDGTSRFDLPSRWTKDQRRVFQPPGSCPLPSPVTAYGKRVALFSLPSANSKRALWAYSK